VFNQLEVAHPFAVSVLKDEVYWDDWTRKSIYSANKDLPVNTARYSGNIARFPR